MSTHTVANKVEGATPEGTGVRISEGIKINIENPVLCKLTFEGHVGVSQEDFSVSLQSVITIKWLVSFTSYR